MSLVNFPVNSYGHVGIFTYNFKVYNVEKFKWSFIRLLNLFCFVDTCDLVHDNMAILKAYGNIFWNMIYALETAISSLTGITHKWFPDAVSS